MTRPTTPRGHASRLLIRDLSALMLATDDVLFLRACLGPDELARSAWEEWRSAGGSIVDAPSAHGSRMKAFAPLLLAAVERGVLSIGRPEITTLKAWRLLERNRAARYRAVLHEVLARLAAADVRPVILKGAALSDTVFPASDLRHSRDIDLLVSREELPRACRALSGPDFTSLARMSGRESVEFLHASRLPVVIHTTFGRVPYYRVPVEEAVAASPRFVCTGIAARRLRSDHALLQACVQGLGKGRSAGAIRWAVDVWHLVERDRSLDWTQVVEQARRHRLGLPVAASLMAVADGLHARVNRRALGALCTAAGRDLPSGIRRLVPLTAAAPRTLSELRAWGGGWLGQTSVALAMLAPSSDYVRWARSDRAMAPIAAAYARPLFVPLRLVLR